MSNRSPLAFAIGKSRISVGRGAGGVVTALGQVANHEPLTWVAPTTTESDREIALSLRERGGSVGRGQLRVRFVDLPPELVAKYSEQFSNQVLWFAQHGLWKRRILPESAEVASDLYRHYLIAAERVGDGVVAEVHRPGPRSAVFSQDYQLYGVPAALRQLAPGLGISHFVHIPWPSLSAWREALPDSITLDIVQRLLGADSVGFQDSLSRDHFVEAAELLGLSVVAPDRLLLKDGRTVTCRVRPASVNPKELLPDRARMVELGRTKIMRIARVDRVDPIKNVPAGFAAFERLLDRHPELVGRVQFLARLLPTRMSIPEYAAEWATTVEAVARVRRRFGQGAVDVRESSSRGEALAELAMADVVLVNSIADGMNLVAKETAVLNRHGALVLSRQAGAWSELQSGAIGVDPTSIDDTAEALFRGLTMAPVERVARADSMREVVCRWSGRDWFEALRQDLEDVRERRDRRSVERKSATRRGQLASPPLVSTEAEMQI